MKRNLKNRSFQRVGVSAVVLGALVFTTDQASAAGDTEFGEKLLYNGKTHDHVIELKELLEETEFYDGEVNNNFDTATEEAVIDFQENYDLLVDGLTGIQTYSALIGLEQGDNGDLVLALQEDLAELDYFTAELDGKFGPLTEEALINFQEEEGVQGEKGIAGPYTYQALYPLTSRYNPELAAPAEEAPSSSEEESSEVSTKEPAESVSSEPSEESTEESTEEVPEESTQESAEASNSNNASSSEESSDSSNDAEGSITMEATAYTAGCEGCSGITATGIDLRDQPNKKVVAVDPSVIPLGSIVEVEGYGRAVAGDTGGAIKGNKIDLHVASKDDAFAFGRKDVNVTIIETP
ncbi:peptidoglycan-binding protein [Salipaludibacillus neizhouensis]|uniref:peptidoglycan-binding protein n=1 Tax=Salipaludibacillus neizhouensis TaxID=885475 RepID=UPI00160064B5|nr:peptidoglycan-binding protein [Salipaludibacillus neizhouensis]